MQDGGVDAEGPGLGARSMMSGVILNEGEPCWLLVVALSSLKAFNPSSYTVDIDTKTLLGGLRIQKEALCFPHDRPCLSP